MIHLQQQNKDIVKSKSKNNKNKNDNYANVFLFPSSFLYLVYYKIGPVKCKQLTVISSKNIRKMRDISRAQRETDFHYRHHPKPGMIYYFIYFF